MIVYREQRRRVRTAEVLRRVREAGGFERQMELGELETGVADALSPDCDASLPLLDRLRRGQWEGLDLPEQIEISVPEGFAHYALDPELYRRAAARFAQEAKPQRIAVIGIRSIGTTLSTIVADELCRHGCLVKSWTVRPRGHPWQRELRVAEDLAGLWRNWDGLFGVVDEGPGLSGSSFASVSLFLASLGVAEHRVVLFPSWLPDGTAFVSEIARRRWNLHRKFVVPFEKLDLFPGAVDLSEGKWRRLRGVAVPVQPQHERRKYLRDGCLYKFAGYGRYGRAKRQRAEALAGWIPRPDGGERGFLRMQWLSGTSPLPTPAFLDYAARYLAVIRREFPSGEPVPFDPLAEMIAINFPDAPDPGRWRSAVLAGSAVALDGRMLPHEWIETGCGHFKTDALDHHDDHFFPGPQDTAWDLASLILEFGLSPDGEAYFLECYQRESHDRDVRARLPFYRLAYLAFRFGYADMAGEDFAGERARYRRLLEAHCG